MNSLKKNNILDKITICILTKDREKDLKKKILFYKKKKINLLILDQSQNSIKNFCDLNLNKGSFYVHRPNMNYLKRFVLIKNFLKTKYFMLQSDDDFFFINTIKKSIFFLEKNRDYVSVSGKVFSLNIFKEKFFFNEIYKKNFKTIKFKESFLRLENVLKDSDDFLNIYYGVVRTKFILKHIKILKNNYLSYRDELHRFHELQYLIVSALSGKIHILDNISYLRVGYNRRLSFPMSSKDNLRIIASSSDNNSLDLFLKNILKCFKKNTNVDKKFLKNLIKIEYSRRFKDKLPYDVQKEIQREFNTN